MNHFDAFDIGIVLGQYMSDKLPPLASGNDKSGVISFLKSYILQVRSKQLITFQQNLSSKILNYLFKCVGYR